MALWFTVDVKQIMVPHDICDMSPGLKARARVTSVISMLGLLLVLSGVLFMSVRSPLKDDIAWLLYVARRWVGGRELYRDLVEVNPPLIIWLSAIPAELARWLNVAPQYVAMPLFIGVVEAFAWWAASLLRKEGRLFASRLPVFAIIGSAVLVLAGADQGQREHLLVAAFLPYLVLFHRSLAGDKPHWTASVAAGGLAGLFCALKPLYGATFLALEILGFSRRLKLLRAMPIAAALTLLAYGVAVIVACPAYLQRAVPMAVALYGATDVPFVTLVSNSALLLAGEAIGLSLLWLRGRALGRHRDLMLVLLVFACTSTIICFIDGKDWYYHRIPATVATVLALILWLARDMAERRWNIRPAPALACAAVTAFCASALYRMEPSFQEALEARRTPVERIEEIVRAEHARSYVAFSEWIALGFPVVNNTGVGWASRFDSMWALKGEVWRSNFDPATPREWPIARWVAHDFIAGCPDIAVVDTRETTNYLKVLTAADAAFARVWTRYQPIASFDGLVVYKRRGTGCLDVWVAAEAGNVPSAR